jgi:peptidoglycan glycosyltransferase
MIYPREHVEAGSRDGGARRNQPSRYSAADVERRRRLLRRLLPAVAIFAVVALAIGLISGRDPGRAARETVQRFATLWSRGDYRGMYALVDDSARAAVTPAEFEAAYHEAARTATVLSLTAGAASAKQDDLVRVSLVVRTRVFGTVHGVLDVPVEHVGEDARVAWRRSLVFPGLQPGEQLTRETVLPDRGTLLARDGAVLAKGTDRSSDIADVAAQIVGRLEPIPAADRPAMAALGYPDDALVGVSGLERVFQQQLAGTPGGQLFGGTRVLASSQPQPAGGPVKTTIDPEVERSAVSNLGSRYGGIAVLEPATGEVLALAGVAFSGLQPPGSTFKIITLTGALEQGIAKPESDYPVVSEAVLSGVPIQNASGEFCGGTLVASFAHSCNSVFAPLGARLGPDKLVDVAERFGFNAPVGIAGAAISTIPAATELGDDLDVGSTAIGQGLVQATALQMTLVAATIANGGKRPVPTLRFGARPRFVRVTTPKIAREIGRMMDEVVKSGTGTAAQIDGVAVAGKTGTAELRSTVAPADGEEPPDYLTDDIPDTDAWFVAYAPEQKPRVAVGVLFTEAGAGGAVAAPAAREVLLTGLQRTRTAG